MVLSCAVGVEQHALAKVKPEHRTLLHRSDEVARGYDVLYVAFADTVVHIERTHVRWHMVNAVGNEHVADLNRFKRTRGFEELPLHPPEQQILLDPLPKRIVDHDLAGVGRKPVACFAVDRRLALANRSDHAVGIHVCHRVVRARPGEHRPRRARLQSAGASDQPACAAFAR